MLKLIIATALLATSACGGGAKTNSTASNTTTTVATAKSDTGAATAAAKAENSAGSANAAATQQDAELAEIQNSNAADATAQAAGISQEQDPDSRAANCIVFLGISRDRNSRPGGFDDAAMEQAQNQWKADLLQRFSEQEMDQLTGSSVNMLEPAAAPQRDAASRWCVQNAPEVDPEG